MVPIAAKTNVEIFETGGALSGMAMRTATSTNVHIVPKITGLLFLGIPFPSR